MENYGLSKTDPEDHLSTSHEAETFYGEQQNQ